MMSAYRFQNTWKIPNRVVCGNLRVTSALTSGIILAPGKYGESFRTTRFKSSDCIAFRISAGAAPPSSWVTFFSPERKYNSGQSLPANINPFGLCSRRKRDKSSKKICGRSRYRPLQLCRNRRSGGGIRRCIGQRHHWISGRHGRVGSLRHDGVPDKFVSCRIPISTVRWQFVRVRVGN